MTIVFGVDIAFTNDKTVVAIREDVLIHPLITINSSDPRETSDIIYELYERIGPSVINIDVIGIGISVVSRLQTLKAPVFPLDVRVRKNKKFKNRRAELYWDLRERLNPATYQEWKKTKNRNSAKAPIFLPKDSDLLIQLSSMTFKYNDVDGSLQIENKNILRDRLGESPDKADAVTYSLPEEGLKYTQLQTCDFQSARLVQSSKWKI